MSEYVSVKTWNCFSFVKVANPVAQYSTLPLQRHQGINVAQSEDYWGSWYLVGNSLCPVSKAGHVYHDESKNLCSNLQARKNNRRVHRILLQNSSLTLFLCCCKCMVMSKLFLSIRHVWIFCPCSFWFSKGTSAWIDINDILKSSETNTAVCCWASRKTRFSTSNIDLPMWISHC